MLKFGDKVISNLYFSDKRISKAYMGSKLIYKEREPIFLDYIGSTGTQWIDTGIEATSITRFVIKGTCETNGASNAQLLGTQNTSAATFFGSRYMSSTGVKSWYCRSAESVSIGNPTNLSIIDCTIESRTSQYGTLTDLVDGSVNEFVNLTDDWGFISGNLLLFGGESTRVSPDATCYSLQLYTANGLVRDLRPCLDPKGVVCMYDIVTKKYFYNQGTDKLIAGPRLLDYIKFDGKSWIDTGITELGGTWTVTASGDDSTQLRFLIGNGGQAANYYGVLSNGKWGLGTASEEYYFENARTSKMTAEVIFEESQATATVDGITLVRPGTKAVGNFLLCGYQSLDTSAYLFKGDVYHCSYVDTTGKLILDLYPAIDLSGVVCMFDKVSHTYYYNQGSGEIKAGGKFVNSILFDGDSYIDTGLKHESCRIETAVKYKSGQSRRMLTGWSGSGSYWGMMSNGKLEISGSGFTTETDLTDYTTLEIVLDNENLLFTVTADNATKTVAAVYASNTYTIGCTVPSSANKIIGNVYYHRAYNIDNVLIQDLRPYLDEDGIPCLYDLVTNVKFYNIGTGTLSYT